MLHLNLKTVIIDKISGKNLGIWLDSREYMFKKNSAYVKVLHVRSREQAQELLNLGLVATKPDLECIEM